MAATKAPSVAISKGWGWVLLAHLLVLGAMMSTSFLNHLKASRQMAFEQDFSSSPPSSLLSIIPRPPEPPTSWSPAFLPPATSDADYISISLQTPTLTREETGQSADDIIRFGRLLEWIKANGGKVDDVEIRTWPNSHERGVFAARDLGEGPFAIIPRNISLRTELAQQDAHVGALVAEVKRGFPFNKEINDRCALALFLAYHHLVAGEASFWFPYLASLPPSHVDPYPSFLYSKPGDLGRLKVEALVGPLVANGLAAIEASVTLALSRTDLFPFPEAQLRRELRWAYFMVTSRAWSREPLEMIPFGDILNHKTLPDVVLESTDDVNTFRMPAGRQVPQGREVFDHYQQTPTPTIYAFSWGFIPESQECFHTLDFHVQDASPARRYLLARLECLAVREVVSLPVRCSATLLDNTTFTCALALVLPEDHVANVTSWIPIKRSHSHYWSDLVPATPEQIVSAAQLLLKNLDGAPAVEDLGEEELRAMLAPETPPIDRLALKLRYSTFRCRLAARSAIYNSAQARLSSLG